MGFMEAVKHVFKNYATFQGRARRSEYWYFALFNFLVSMVASGISIGLSVAGLAGSDSDGFLEASLGGASFVYLLLAIYNLACFIPSLALTCRRLHDVGKPGTYMLFFFLPVVGGILMLVWVLQDSMPYDNQYGPNPKQAAGQRQASWQPQPSVQPQPAVRPQPSVQPQDPAKTTPNRQQLPTPLQNDLNAGSARIVGVVGEMQGRSFVVPDRVKIGRGADCNIQFQAGGGVSRQHCELSYYGGTLYIRDLGSSYGTYINGNTRLVPNQPMALKSGDQISLGSSHEILQVM